MRKLWGKLSLWRLPHRRQYVRNDLKSRIFLGPCPDSMRSPHVFIQLDPPRSENPLKEMGISGWLRGTSRVYFPVFICCSNLSCTDQPHLLWKVKLNVFSWCDFFKIVLHNLLLFIFVLVWTLLLLFLRSIVFPVSFNLCIFFLFSICLNPLCSFSDIVPTQMTIRRYECFFD